VPVVFSIIHGRLAAKTAPRIPHSGEAYARQES
jgi:hypothetical protein